MSEEADRESPIVRKRDVYPPLIGAAILLFIDGYLLVPGIGLILSSLMIFAALLAWLGKLVRRRGGKAKAAIKMFAYCLCLGGIYGAHYMHREDARSNAIPIIAAIEQYRMDENVYPESLQKLVPKYLPEIPRPTWRYNAGKYHLTVIKETDSAELWWPAHIRVALSYDFTTEKWQSQVWD